MKKFFLSIVAALIAVPTFAQYSSGGFTLSESSVYYGVRLGVTFAGISGESATIAGVALNNDYSSLNTGMTLAGVAGLRLSESTPIFMESGLYYTERGGKKDNETVSLNYLEVPLLIKYGIQATSDIAILPFIGPYFSWGMGGKTKTKGVIDPTNPGSTYTAKHSSYNDNCFTHGDMGFKVGCGAEYNMLYLELAYQAGVANISKADDLTAHGHAITLNFGVNF